jgi:hypothetical protein
MIIFLCLYEHYEICFSLNNCNLKLLFSPTEISTQHILGIQYFYFYELSLDILDKKSANFSLSHTFLACSI